MQKEETSAQDALDVLFEHRNKHYGAYALRRGYPLVLRRALTLTLAAVVLFFLLPYFITGRLAGPAENVKNLIEVVIDVGVIPDIDPQLPPPPPPPAVQSPPPPQRSTVAFTPPVVMEDRAVPVEENRLSLDALNNKQAEIGKETRTGNNNAPPAQFDDPVLLPSVEGPKSAPEPEKTFEPYDVQKEPAFPGGEAELRAYLSKNIRYPALARQNNIQGTVVLSFIIDKNGNITDVKVVRDIGGGCGKEAERVVKSMPAWMPGEANGHPVKVRFTLPVKFKLQ